MPTSIITAETVPAEKMDESYIRRELPVLIKGGCKDWPAYTKWTTDFFKKEYGSVPVPLSNYKRDPYQSAQSKPDMAITEYLDIALRIAAGHSDPNEDLYSAGWFFCNGYAELLEDTRTLPCFADNWADKVQKVIHFDSRSIIFGHPKVESPLHTDSFFVSTWFAMLRGQKRMRMVAPEYSKHVHNGYNIFSDDLLQRLLDADVPVYECTIEEGDIAWFPPGWWHHVKNDTFVISLTTNFVSAYHFLPFEQQVRSTILKPLLNLAKVKEECLRVNGTSELSVKTLRDAKYLSLEEKFVNHFQSELEKTSRLLEVVKARL